MLKHVVMIKYKPDTSEAHIQRFVQQARDMFGQIPELLEIEVGRDVVEESRSWHVVLLTRFDDAPALRRYQGHPVHEALMVFNGPFVESVAVVDYPLPDYGPAD